jgi:hypothetical protein
MAHSLRRSSGTHQSGSLAGYSSFSIPWLLLSCRKGIIDKVQDEEEVLGPVMVVVVVHP